MSQDRTAEYSSAIFPQHQQLLRASAIAPEVAAARGYVSMGEGDRAKLESLGFSPAQRRVPGLLIPIRHRDGRTATLQYRPDQPRELSDRLVKYESLPKRPVAIDVHPMVAAELGNPEVDLWITEGARKVDAGISVGLCVVGLSGVWCWRGSNGDGGRTALADWDDIALNDRLVFIAFDADSTTNPKVAAALSAFEKFLRYKGATVNIVTIPRVNDDPHTGLDDYIASGGSVAGLLSASSEGVSDNGTKPTASSRRIRLTWADTIAPEPVIWAWLDEGEGRLPVGCLALAAGREGTGKSSFGIWMTAQITTGKLPGAFFGAPRNVLYAAVEDSWKHTIVPRLIAAGADLTRVARVDVVVKEDNDGTVLVLPDDNKMLEQTIKDNDVPLVILDPLMSTVDSSLDTHKTREVRQALDPLNSMAERVGCLILGIAHFNKASSSDVPNLITGSGAFRDVPRALLGFARNEKQRVMTQVKNSLGRDDLPSLEYKIETAGVETATGLATVGKFSVVGPTETTVQDLLSEARENRPPGKAAQDWASDYLTADTRHFEAKSTDLFAAAKKNDLHERTVRRALKKIGAHPTRKTFGGEVVWLHPTHPDHPNNQSGLSPDTSGSGQNDDSQSGQPDQAGHSLANLETGQTVAGMDEDRPGEGYRAVLPTPKPCTICAFPTTTDTEVGARCRDHDPLFYPSDPIKEI